jgi:hypothetical protein
VNDADFETASYRHCATGYLNTAAAMRWFWETYLGRQLGPGAEVPPETTPLRVADPFRPAPDGGGDDGVRPAAYRG